MNALDFIGDALPYAVTAAAFVLCVISRAQQIKTQALLDRVNTRLAEYRAEVEALEAENRLYEEHPSEFERCMK